jgi:hypothetical protein
MKVDSMDNTYDKRISNLEAVITPLLSETRDGSPEAIQSLISQELKQVVTVMDDKIRKALNDKD